MIPALPIVDHALGLAEAVARLIPDPMQRRAAHLATVEARLAVVQTRQAQREAAGRKPSPRLAVREARLSALSTSIRGAT